MAAFLVQRGIVLDAKQSSQRYRPGDEIDAETLESMTTQRARAFLKRSGAIVPLDVDPDLDDDEE